jgi:octaprenyl-diphosphate synthase
MDLPLMTHMPENTPWREIPPLRRIDASLRRVRDLIHRSLEARSAQRDLASFVGHLRACGGKMLRPGMVLLAGECFGPLTQEHTQVSAMVEMIHHATLLHDDVIDDGCKRRGVPTVNFVWGNECAVLLGDFILSQVFRMAADLDPAVARVLAQTAMRVCEGELRQTVQKRNWQLSEAEYIEIITEKSASFFGGCCRLGAMLSHADENQIESLARFGLLAGVAFQITDDLLDIAGDENRTGKTVQSDLAKDKPTLAVIHLLATIDAARQVDVCAILESSGQSQSELVDMLERHGSLRYARERAAHYVAKATHELQNVPSSQAKEALIETAHFMANRTA